MQSSILDFSANITLENHRVRLEPLSPNNIPLLFHFSEEEPELWTYSLIPANGREQYDIYMQKALDDRQARTAYPFAVYDKVLNAYAGSTRFYDYQAYHETTQLGFTWYGKKYQGTGLNKHCKFLMLKYAFEQLQLVRVEFRADSNNARSIAAMKRIGCTEEGVLRSNCKSLDGRRDSIILSILANEWHANVKTSLLQQLD